jgi:hypothetical protein
MVGQVRSDLSAGTSGYIHAISPFADDKTGKPPTLSVDSQGLTITGIKGKFHNSEPLKVKKRRLPMHDEQSLSHTMSECKYHVLWIGFAKDPAAAYNVPVRWA